MVRVAESLGTKDGVRAHDSTGQLLCGASDVRSGWNMGIWNYGNMERLSERGERGIDCASKDDLGKVTERSGRFGICD